MRKGRRVLIGLLCMVLLLTNTLSSEIRVFAVENGNESRNMENIVDEAAGSASSDEGVENKDSQPDDSEEESDHETTPEESESENQEQEESENKEVEEDVVKDETDDSEGGEEQVISDHMEKNTGDEKEADTKAASSLSAEERLASMRSDGDIDWGTDGDIAWVIDANGKLTVEGSGDFTSSGDNYLGYSYPKWYDDKQFIISAEINVEGMTNTSGMFYSCYKLLSVDLSKFKTGNVTDMNQMFDNCGSLQSLDLSNFDTSQVTNMRSMFSNCGSLQSLDLSSFDTSQVTDMDFMFGNSSGLQSLDLSNFNTSRVTDMAFMFSGCSSLESLDLSNFDTSQVTDMRDMFINCSSLESLDLSSFDTSKVTDMETMFCNCGSLENLDLSNFDTRQVTNMYRMFYGCSSLKSLDLSSFDTSKITDMLAMFFGCSSLESLDLSNFATSKITCMDYMFSGCSSLESLDLSNFDTSKVTRMHDMFYRCSSLESLDLSNFATGKLISMENMFTGCSNLQSLDLSSFDTSKVTNMIGMFSGCSELESLDLSSFDTSKVTNMIGMFYGCSSLRILDLSSFDTSNVTDARVMFGNDYQPLNLYTIYTPYNLNIEIDLPIKSEQWYLSDGSTVTSLPKNLNYSVELGRGYIPEERVNLSGNWDDIDWSLQSGVLRLSSDAAGGAAMPDIDADKVPNIPWFQYRNQIKKIIIGEEITHIGNYTFSGCHQVKEIAIAEGVTSIGKDAFYKCTALEKIAIPSSVTQIGTWAFADNEALKTITIPEGVTEIGEMMFQGCSVLDNIYIPSTVTKIGLDAFNNCKKLETIRFGGLRQEWEKIDFHTSIKKKLVHYIIRFSDGSFYQKTEYAGEFSYINSSNESLTSKYTYSCNLKHFLQSSYTYQHDLTQLSIRVAMSAMGTGDGTGTENIRSLMDDMGFRYTLGRDGSIQYDTPNGDTIGYAIGRKKIISTNGKENTLILVAVRGGGYGNEWAGNFKIGMGTHHAGFETAAKQVKEGLSKFLKDEGITADSSVHVWICGYSRAAATSNLLAAKLDDGEIKGIIPMNVHAFCFECPQNTTAANVNDSLYSNIVNVVNPVDLVPMVAPNNNVLWKYTRYGQTYVLPSKNNTKTAKYKSLKKSMESCYKEIVEYRGESFNTDYTDVAILQAEQYEDIVKNLTVFVKSPEIYTEELQSEIYNAVYDYYTDKTIPIPALELGDIFGIVWKTVDRVYANVGHLIIWKYQYIPVIETTLANILLTGKNIKASHYPELCLAWVDSLQGDNEFTVKRSYYKVYINCPVNIGVYEESALVGAIHNDIPQEIDDGVETYIDDNGQKVLVLPGDGNFEIKLDSYDDGNVTYTVAAFEGTASAPSQLVSYYELGVEDGSKLTGTIENSEISLMDGNYQTLDPDFEQSGDNIPLYALELSSEGNGAAIGEGAYNPGEYVKLIAIAETEAEFLGWKIGDEIVSMDEEYRILMDGDKKITAVFSTIHDGIWSEGINDVVYTGSNITQSFRLYDGEECLQEKVDYTVSYKNNKNAYTYTDEDYAGFENYLQITGKSIEFGTFDPKKAPQVVVKMKGNYSGSQTIYFRIQPANITDDSFSTANLAVTYSDKKQTPVPTVTWNGKSLKYNTDFYVPEYDYVKNDKAAFSYSGIYDLTVVGKNNFTGEIPITLTISESNKQIAMGSVTIKGVGNQVWTGEQILPEGYTVKYKSDVLSEANGDYTVSFGENTAVGTGTITLTGTGTDNDGDGYSYIGTKTVSFKITGTAMSKVTVSGVDKSYPYSGTAIEPSATLTYKANKNSAPVTLVKDTHYTVTYQRNLDTGTATIIFTGLESGGYTGTKKITFKIAASGITDKIESGNPVKQIQITYKDVENIQEGIYVAPYMKGGAKPEVIVTSGSKTLKSGKDYTISYANNKKIALSTDKKAPTITVKGKGNYSGSKKVNFTIAVKPLSEENGITVVAKDKAASTKKNGYKQSFKVYDADGKALGSGDYDSKNVIYTLIQTINEDGTMNAVNEVLDQNSIVLANSVIQITVQGKGNYAGGSVSGTYRILEANHDISKATIQINNQEYTGQPVMITDQSQFKPNKVYIKIGKEMKTLTLGEDIEVVPDSYIKNVNKGTAKVTFRGINDFGGTKTVSYKIGARSITDFWRGIFSKIKGLMAYNETRIAFPKYVARMI